MPVKAKAGENLAKHLTKEEIAAREQAEAEVMPLRPDSLDKWPDMLRGKDKAAAQKYWKAVVARMKGYAILDVLDSDTLGIYCLQMARRDKLEESLADAEDSSAAAKELQALEKLLLSYAEKLGLTPASRVALARKRAAAVGAEERDDLFGDCL